MTLDEIAQLIARQRTDRYVARACEELGLRYVDDARDLTWIYRRAEALEEELSTCPTS